MGAKQKIMGAITAIVVALSSAVNVFADNTRCDVNKDGHVNAKDSLVLLKLALNGVNAPEYDINGDGYVNAKDALFVLKVSLGMIEPEVKLEVIQPMTYETDSILDDYTQKWAYNTLSDDLKAVYKALYEGITKGLNSIDVSKLSVSVEDLRRVFWACDFDNPQLLNIADGCSYSYFGSKVHSVAPMYGRDAKQAAKILSEVKANTASVIAAAKTLKSEYERVKLFHDWIIDNTSYVLEGGTHISETDGPIVNKEALCEGYSKAFAYLCQSVGINCVCVNGHGNGGDHVWNMVQVDGNWYHIDVTWDDPITTTGEQVRRYTYFLMSDAQILTNHSIENMFKLPSAPKVYGR